MASLASLEKKPCKKMPNKIPLCSAFGKAGSTPKNNFFCIPLGEIKGFFDLMDGEIWTEQQKDEQENEYLLPDDLEDQDTEIEEKLFKEYSKIKKESKREKRRLRNMKLCFSNGQQIRHVIKDDIWIGTYNYSKNTIAIGDKEFTSLSGFSVGHYHAIGLTYRSSANGWKECECKKNNKWISTYNL